MLGRIIQAYYRPKYSRKKGFLFMAAPQLQLSRDILKDILGEQGSRPCLAMQDRISPRVRFRTWKTICSQAAAYSASQLSDPSVCTSFHGLRCSDLGALELDACTLQSFFLSHKVVDCSGSSLGLQEARGCCDSCGLVAGGLPVARCRAARCEHTHSRRLAAAADREPCPAFQGFCCSVLVLPVCHGG